MISEREFNNSSRDLGEYGIAMFKRPQEKDGSPTGKNMNVLIVDRKRAKDILVHLQNWNDDKDLYYISFPPDLLDFAPKPHVKIVEAPNEPLSESNMFTPYGVMRIRKEVCNCVIGKDHRDV